MTDGSGTDFDASSDVVVDGKKLTKAEIQQMDASIERVIASAHQGRPEAGAAAPADERDVEQRRLDVLKGRQHDASGHWRQVMEWWGFNWLEPAQLDATVGPLRYVPSQIKGLAGEVIHDHLGRPVANTNLYWTKPHREGQWRSDLGKRKPPRDLLGDKGAMAFTMTDLIDLFGAPQKFDEWAKLRVEKAIRARAAFRRRRR